MAQPRKPARRTSSDGPSGLARLWAPWRSAYLRAATSGKSRGCIFCIRRASAAELRRRLVLHAGQYTLVMLNRYPYSNGHVMVAPRRHLGSPEMLSREERAIVGEVVAEAVRRMREVLRPDGFNLGANLGRTAGAGFADHMHWHVVPRWNGDTNFMPVLAATRVLSQHLDESYKLLVPIFKAIEPPVS
jgi:ATP adenylyltransferase